MIWPLRHGDAEEADDDDAAGRLTEKGERQAEAAGRALEAIEVATGARVELKKGGLAAIDGGTLIALLTPTQLAAIARAR